MTKYSRAERLAAAQAVEAGDSVGNVAKRLGMSRQVVQWSVRLYRGQGEAGFQTKKASYTAAQKLVILETMHSQGMSNVEAAVKFGIGTASTIWEWERRYLENGMEGLTPKKKGRRPRVPRPKAPLTPYEQLWAENEYLKKLNALVAEREAREKQNKKTE
jgi:transposase